MKLKITTNFDFGQLAKKLDKVIDVYTSSYGKESAEASKKAIDSGLTPPLEESTKNIRKKRKQPVNPPLKATGALYKSIKQKGDSLEMLYYGRLHNKGFTTKSNSMIPNKKVPARQFIVTTVKNKKTILTQFMQSVRKNLRKTKG